MTLAEYVDDKINDPDVGSPEWFPLGLIYRKGGLIHVQDADNLDVTLCDKLVSDAKHVGPARVMLRRAAGCQECEGKV